MDKIKDSLTTKIELEDTFVAVKENIKNTTYNFEFGDEISKVVPLVKVVRNTYNTNKDRELSSTIVSSMLKEISATMVGEENVVDRAGNMFLLKGEPIKKALHSALDYFTSGTTPIVNINSTVLDELKTAITNINNAEKWNYAVKWSSELKGIAEIVGILETGTSGMTSGDDITEKINSSFLTLVINSEEMSEENILSKYGKDIFNKYNKMKTDAQTIIQNNQHAIKAHFEVACPEPQVRKETS